MPEIHVLQREFNPMTEDIAISVPEDSPMWCGRLLMVESFVEGVHATTPQRVVQSAGRRLRRQFDSIRDARDRSYAEDSVVNYTERAQVRRLGAAFSEANAVMSLAADGMHYPAFDVDHPIEVRPVGENHVALCVEGALAASLVAIGDVWLVPSSTPGHMHVYGNRAMAWCDYADMLDRLAADGIVEPNYVAVSKAKGYTCLRFPGTTRDTPARVEVHEPSWRAQGSMYNWVINAPQEDPQLDALLREEEEIERQTRSVFDRVTTTTGLTAPAAYLPSNISELRPSERPFLAQRRWGGYWWPVTRGRLQEMSYSEWNRLLDTWRGTTDWAQLPFGQRSRLEDAQYYANGGYHELNTWGIYNCPREF